MNRGHATRQTPTISKPRVSKPKGEVDPRKAPYRDLTSFPEIQESLRRFRRDHPAPSSVAFIIMRFIGTPAHRNIVGAIRAALQPHAINAVRADEKQYHDDLYYNILTYIAGCGFGIAVFERIQAEDFNPNIAFEVGYLTAIQKPVCLLKDNTLRHLHTDLVGKLYRPFDPQDPLATIPGELTHWMRDKGIFTLSQAETPPLNEFYSEPYWLRFHRVTNQSLEALLSMLLDEPTLDRFITRCISDTQRRRAFLDALKSSNEGQLLLNKANKVRALAHLQPYGGEPTTLVKNADVQ